MRNRQDVYQQMPHLLHRLPIESSRLGEWKWSSRQRISRIRLNTGGTMIDRAWKMIRVWFYKIAGPR